MLNPLANGRCFFPSFKHQESPLPSVFFPVSGKRWCFRGKGLKWILWPKPSGGIIMEDHFRDKPLITTHHHHHHHHHHRLWVLGGAFRRATRGSLFRGNNWTYIRWSIIVFLPVGVGWVKFTVREKVGCGHHVTTLAPQNHEKWRF